MTHQRWTPLEELKLLKNGNLPNQELHKIFPHRSLWSVKRKKRFMKMVKPQVRWSQEDLELLAAGQLVPGHTFHACRRKWIRLKQGHGETSK